MYVIGCHVVDFSIDEKKPIINSSTFITFMKKRCMKEREREIRREREKPDSASPLNLILASCLLLINWLSFLA